MNTAQTFTVYVQIMPDGSSLPLPRAWVPWINSTSIRETSALAANKHVRERGGVPLGETYTFRVLAYTDGMIETTGKTLDGNPTVMLSTKFTAAYNVERQAKREAVVA